MPERDAHHSLAQVQGHPPRSLMGPRSPKAHRGWTCSKGGREAGVGLLLPVLKGNPGAPRPSARDCGACAHAARSRERRSSVGWEHSPWSSSHTRTHERHTHAHDSTHPGSHLLAGCPLGGPLPLLWQSEVLLGPGGLCSRDRWSQATAMSQSHFMMDACGLMAGAPRGERSPPGAPRPLGTRPQDPTE